MHGVGCTASSAISSSSCRRPHTVFPYIRPAHIRYYNENLLQADPFTYVHKISADGQDLGDRIDYIENKMGELTIMFNTMIDAHENQRDAITWLKNKIVDLEVRSRCNHLKIYGIPETVLSSQLPHFVWDLFLAVVPSLTSSDLTIERFNRLPKPIFFPSNMPRDVLLWFHLFQAKERLLGVFHKKDCPPEQAAGLQVLPDLSAHTLHQHKNLDTITKSSSQPLAELPMEVSC